MPTNLNKTSMLNLFTDHNVPIKITHGLDSHLKSNRRGKCVALSTMFSQSAPDVYWINKLSSCNTNWTILSCDKGITRHQGHRQVLQNSGLFFFLMNGKFQMHPIDERIKVLISMVNKIHQHVSNANNHRIMRVTMARKLVPQ